MDGIAPCPSCRVTQSSLRKTCAEYARGSATLDFVAMVTFGVAIAIIAFAPIGFSIGVHDANTTAVSIIFDTESLAVQAQFVEYRTFIIVVGILGLCAVAWSTAANYKFAYRACWALAYHDCICMIDANNRFVQAFAECIAQEKCPPPERHQHYGRRAALS